MPAAVVFILFVICLIIAIPVSIALTIASVLPGAFDPSFTASGQFVIRSMLGGIDSFPLLAVPMFVLSGIIMARGGISIFPWKSDSRSSVRGHCNLSVLWRNLRFRTGDGCSSRKYDDPDSDRARIR